MVKTSQRLSHQTKSCQSSQTQNTIGVRVHLRLGTCYVLVLMELQCICGMDTQGDESLLDAWAEMRRKLSSHSAQVWCRWDNNSHMGPTYLAQFRGLESAIRVSPNMTFFYPIKLENYTRRIKSRFSEVLRTSPYPSQKVQLILTILTVVSLFPYLFWGMRNGSCHFSVYLLFFGIPWTYPDVLYIAGKIFLRGIQRSWNRGKRFSGDGVIRETSLTIMAHRGE